MSQRVRTVQAEALVLAPALSAPGFERGAGSCGGGAPVRVTSPRAGARVACGEAVFRTL